MQSLIPSFTRPRLFAIFSLTGLLALLVSFPLGQPQAQTTPKLKVPAGAFKRFENYGFITVQTPATNMFLRALDATGHVGVSGSFAVEGGTGIQITSVRLDAAGVRLGFTTVPGRSYRVERTGSLNGVPSWTPVPGAVSVSAVGGQTEVIDATGAYQPQQFYRVRLLP